MYNEKEFLEKTLTLENTLNTTITYNITSRQF